MAIDVDSPDKPLGGVGPNGPQLCPGDMGEKILGPQQITHTEECDEQQRPSAAPVRRHISRIRSAFVSALLIVMVLAGLVGWLSYRTYESRHVDAQRNLFLHVGRQVALALSTIDADNAEANVQLILNSATGTFHDEFQQRSQAFVEVVQHAQSKSEGTVTEAGVESQQDETAEVLVILTVKTATPDAPEGPPRSWRMRMHLQKDGDGAKVANVEFVP